MNNTGPRNTDERGIQSLLDQYLTSRNTLKSSAGEISLHLDEDSLASFAEGTLSKRESAPVISHLVNCGFCRHKTAELVLLDLELSATEERTVQSATTEPSAISRVLNDVLSKIFGTTDQAVFAHNEEENDDQTETDDRTGKEDKKEE